MNLNQITEKLGNKFRLRDQKGLCETLDKIPDIYPFLSEQQVLILQIEYPKLKEQIETCKWRNLTQKMCDEVYLGKKLIRMIRGEPEPRNIDDDIRAFINLLLSFEWEESSKEENVNPKTIRPEHLITLTVAAQNFDVSHGTLQRAIKDGRLTAFPQADNAAKNAALLIDPVKVASLWPKR